MTMLSRRTLLGGTAALALVDALPAGAASPAPARPNLFIGTGGDGHTFPGATMPFGMVQLSPDTDTARWATCSGYHKDDTSILGFSHTHLSGTGIGDMLDILVVPTRGPVLLDGGPLDDPDKGYRQRFSDEVAEPGYYAVTLESGVRSELTVTDRTGIHRHRFPGGPGHILIDLSHLVMEGPNQSPYIDEAALTLEPDGTITGTRRVFRWAKGRRIFFAMQLSRAPDRIEFFGDDDRPAGGRGVTGKRLKAVLHYDDAGAAPIVIRTGISAVDLPGARGNLAVEATHWDFDRYAGAARLAWAREMDLMRFEGGPSSSAPSPHRRSTTPRSARRCSPTSTGVTSVSTAGRTACRRGSGVQRLFAVGHLSRLPPPADADPARADASLHPRPDPPDAAEPVRPAGLAVAGGRNRHDDRLARRPGPCGGAREGRFRRLCGGMGGREEALVRLDDARSRQQRRRAGL